ncbi:hypothetical protein KUTeg_010998 [Tegillarca granosa]|uniref:Fibronectin type-III domain-containing protein n=1 Tax=Tegillarca granosa TaxID=220873 RepID=A0ABQ9F2L8_TEGGR|nr:hypothetical protein KUTeg_010998 [Tegillarca granosa]
MNITAREANIQHLKPNTEYIFRIRAYNSYGPSVAFAESRITTDRDVDVPSPAINVRAIPMSPDSILVQWDPPRYPKGTIVKYLIIYYEVGANGEHRVESPTLSYMLNGLEKYRDYSFRVVAYNENGEGMSTEEFVARTFSDRPDGPPQNFTLETASSTSIIVRWEPPALELQNGVITGYKIRYRKRERKGGSTQTTDGNRRLYALTDLKKDTEYEVRISALTVNGSGVVTPWHRATTYRDDLDESVVPPPPRKVRVTPHHDSIRVSWSAPPPESKILVRGYTLGYGKGVPDVYKITLDADEHVYTIKNLKPTSEYVITVRAFNNRGDGEIKYQTATTSKQTVPEQTTPMMPPVGLKAIVLSSTTVVLIWTDTSLGQNQIVMDNRYYTVRYKALPGNNNRKFRYSNSSDLNAHIDGLKPYTKYEFSVKVIKGRRQSTWSLSVINTTQEAKPGSNPRDLTPVGMEGKPTAVTLNWQPPSKPNGQITGYLVFYTTDMSKQDFDWVVEGVLGDELSKTISGLTVDTTYYFKVQARNNQGYGPVSNIIIYKTPKGDGTGGGVIHPQFKTDFTGEIPDTAGQPAIAMVTALPNGGLQSMDPHSGIPHARPGFPRTQYNMQYTTGPRVNAGDLPQPSPMKPQQSPYKKPTPPVASVPIKPRAAMPPIMSTPKAPDVILKPGKEDPDLQKSVSTEELTAEMANLDCLMKDLNAITQQDFEC